MPAPFAVPAAQALLALQRLAGADGGAVGPADLLGVLLRYGVEESEPRGVAGVLAPDAVAVVDLAIGPGRLSTSITSRARSIAWCWRSSSFLRQRSTNTDTLARRISGSNGLSR